MTDIEIFGEPGYWSGTYDDDGQHKGHKLAPCPFCGEQCDLEIMSTHTPLFWVKCACGAERPGEYHEGAATAPSSVTARRMFNEAMESAVKAWNTRAPLKVTRPQRHFIKTGRLNGFVYEDAEMTQALHMSGLSWEDEINGD